MEHAPLKSNVFDQNCGSQQVLSLVANKWTALVICALAQETKRHNELKREIGGISQKMLTQTLRSLEQNGLVERKVYPVVPPKVEYALTPLGQTLIGLLQAVCQWAEQHLPELNAAKAAYDDGKAQQNTPT